MADAVSDSIKDIFAKEVDALQAAREEVEVATPPEEPESVADAFEIGTTEPLPVLSPEPVFPSDVLRGDPITPLAEMAPPGPPAADPLLAPLGPPATDPLLAPLSPPATDPLLAPLGPPAAPPMDATPPGPPAAPPMNAAPPGPPPADQPLSAPPMGAFGAPPGPPPSDAAPPGPPGPPEAPPGPPGPPEAPPMDAVPLGPPDAPPGPPGPPEAPPMDAVPPGPPGPPDAPPGPPGPPDSPSGPPPAPPMDAVPPPMPSLDAAVPGPPGPPVDLLAIAAEEIPTPPVADILAPPVAAKEAKFGSVDIGAWDSNWGDTWSESADVFEPSDPGHVPEAIQEMVAWQTGDEAVPVTMSQVPLPSTATLKRMKKGELADLAKARKVDGSGTKAEIIARLLK